MLMKPQELKPLEENWDTSASRDGSTPASSLLSVVRTGKWLKVDARPTSDRGATFAYQSRFLVCVQTVIRWTSKRLAMEKTLSPFALAVRIASTSFAVKGVLVRLVGSRTAAESSVCATGVVSVTPRRA